MKRANGTGSIYKRKDTKRRNPYVAVINLGMDSTGKRKKKIIGSFPTYREAQRSLEIYNTSTPEERRSNQITLGELWEAHKDQCDRINKPVNKTALSIYRTHVAPFGKKKIGDIKTIDIQYIVDHSNLVHVGQQKILSIFHAIYKLAMANDIVSKDYSRFVVIKEAVKSTIHKPFTEDEMRFLWANTDNMLYKIVLIQCYTGTRANELQKMLIENVKLKEQYMIGGSKTEAGKNRIIPIADCILPFIKEFYRKSMFKKSKYLFTPEKGLPSKNGTLYFGTIYDKLNLTNRHLSHDARHTFITLSSNYHIDDMIVKLIVGHAQSDITKDVYTHKRKEQLLNAVNFLPHGKSMIFCPDDFGSHLVATE